MPAAPPNVRCWSETGRFDHAIGGAHSAPSLLAVTLPEASAALAATARRRCEHALTGPRHGQRRPVNGKLDTAMANDKLQDFNREYLSGGSRLRNAGNASILRSFQAAHATSRDRCSGTAFPRGSPTDVTRALPGRGAGTPGAPRTIKQETEKVTQTQLTRGPAARYSSTCGFGAAGNGSRSEALGGNGSYGPR